jgi:hypothetical protein
MICYWERIIYNGYEPDNTITIYAKDMGEYYQMIGVSGRLKFADGYSQIAILRNKETNDFSWLNDDKEGVSSTFDEAWQNLPALVTQPDHFEDGRVIKLSEED